MVDAPQHDLPPYPWPGQPDPPGWQPCPPGGATCLGSWGTVWTFKASALRARCIALGMGEEWLQTVALWLSWANDRLADWQSGGCTLDDPDDTDPDPTLGWVSTLGERMTLDLVRVGIHARLSTVEEVLHTFHLKKVRNGSTAPDLAAVQALVADLATKWKTWFTTAQGAYTPSEMFATQLVYDEVRASVISYDTPTDDPTEGHETIVPTQVAVIATPCAGTHNMDDARQLPNEVALCLTLGTTGRGRSKRGRVYFGGLTSDALAGGTGGGAGLFFTSRVQPFAASYGLRWVDLLHTATDYDMVIASTRAHEGNKSSNAWSAPSALGVSSVKVGVVPDSQRRRRKAQVEAPYLAWGEA